MTRAAALLGVFALPLTAWAQPAPAVDDPAPAAEPETSAPTDDPPPPVDEGPVEGVETGPGFGSGAEWSYDESDDLDDGTWAPAEFTPFAPYAGGNVLHGLRIAPYGAGSGVDVGYLNVVGGNGGTRRALLRARYATGRVGVMVGLPFASYRAPRQLREIGLGNLQLAGWYSIVDDGSDFLAVGMELHGNLGDRTYTWAHDHRELWPGYGAAATLQGSRAFGDLTLLTRGAIGARTGGPYGPVEARSINFELGAGLDARLSERFGIIGETTFSWWDLSPWDLVVLGRADLLEGVRLRAGAVAPIGVWAGLTRMDQRFHGLREFSIVADLSISL